MMRAARMVQVLFLLGLVVQPVLADVNTASHLALTGSFVEIPTVASEFDHILTSMSRQIFSRAEHLLENSPTFVHLWDVVLKPRLEATATKMSGSSTMKTFLLQSPKSQLKAYQELLQEESLLELESSGSQQDAHLNTLTGLMVTYTTMLGLTIFVLATTTVFRKPVRPEGKSQVTVCRKGLPHFVCTKPRMLLFLVIIPIMFAISYTVITRSLKYLSRSWGIIFFLWGLLSFVLLFSLTFGGKLDVIAIRTRCSLHTSLQKWRETRVSRENVVEETDPEGFDGDLGDAIPQAAKQMKEFFKGTPN